jgi:AcrR family transcriptional regulator
MSEVGVDAAPIKEITARADVGFGTFYNYFATKDQLANEVLDCLIHDYGRRNIIATKGLRSQDPAMVMPISIRLVIREAARSPMWQWWAMRPDLLVDRMREGFAEFGLRDMRDALERGIFNIAEEDQPAVWALAVWMMVGGIHDMVSGRLAPEKDGLIVEAIMRVMGMSPENAHRAATTPLPKYAAAKIDWTFQLEQGEREDGAD